VPTPEWSSTASSNEKWKHDRDFGRKYDKDLNTTLIFMSVDLRAGGGLEDYFGPNAYHSHSLVYSQP